MTAVRTITRLQDADDAPTLGAGQNGMALVWDNSAGAFGAAAAAGGGRVYDIVVDAAGGGDYTTLSAAVTAASAGDAIYVRNGTVPGGVTIDKALTVVGESREAVLQSPLSSAPCLTITAADVTVENLTIDGRRASQSGTGDQQNFTGVWNNGGARMALRNVRVHSTLGNGVTITSVGGPNSRIEGCSIENIATDGTSPTLQPVLVGVQVFGTASKQVQITGNYLTGWSQAVGLWYGPSECVVAFNQCVANCGYYNGAADGTRSAIEDYGATTPGHGYNIWHGNIIDGSASCCIECAQGVTGSQFVANICRNYDIYADNTGGPFVIVTESGQVTADIVMRDNVFFGRTASARACVVTGPGHIIAGNKFYNFTNAGIASGIVQAQGATTTSLRIENNLLSNCRGAIYTGTAMADGAVISGNTIKLPASDDALIRITAGGKHIIANNTLDGNSITSLMGIKIESTAGDGHRITENTLTAFAATGIFLQRGYCQITHNHSVGTATFGGIQLDGANALRNNVRWNYVDSNNAARTIYVSGGALYNVIQENYLIGAAAGVYSNDASAYFAHHNGNIPTPNDRSTLTYRIPLTGRGLGAQTVGASQATIAHGLPWVPREVRIRMTSTGMIWESAAADATNIYLTADDANRTCEVTVL